MSEEAEVDEVETQAREKGWKPQEEWDGDPDKWAPPGEFLSMKKRQLERAEEASRLEIKNLNKKVEDGAKVIEELRQTIDDFKEHRTKAEQRAYKRAYKEIEAKMDKAAEDGDSKAYREAKAEAEAVQKDAEEAAKESKPKGKAKENPDEIPAYRDWIVDNEWYRKDVRMRAYAHQVAPEVIQISGLSERDPAFYEQITKAVKEQFPDKFKNARRNGAAAVEDAGGAGAAKRGNGKSFQDLPSDAKETFARFVKQGLYENNTKAKAEYAEEYFDE